MIPRVELELDSRRRMRQCRGSDRQKCNCQYLSHEFLLFWSPARPPGSRLFSSEYRPSLVRFVTLYIQICKIQISNGRLGAFYGIVRKAAAVFPFEIVNTTSPIIGAASSAPFFSALATQILPLTCHVLLLTSRILPLTYHYLPLTSRILPLTMQKLLLTSWKLPLTFHKLLLTSSKLPLTFITLLLSRAILPLAMAVLGPAYIALMSRWTVRYRECHSRNTITITMYPPMKRDGPFSNGP